MRATFKLLLAIAVLVCGLHIAEPVQAHGDEAHHALGFAAAGLDHGDHGNDKAAGDAAHAVYHHCPIAPAGGPVAPMGEATPASALPPLGRDRPLASLAQAPPLQPPSA